MIHVENVSKTFVLHQQNGVRLPVLQNASLEVSNGECVVLHGHSGSGKSTLLRSCTPIICRTKAISISAITMNGLIWSGLPRAKCWKYAARRSAGSASSCG